MKYIIAVVFFVFTACSSSENEVKIKGSDTEVNLSVLLAESFHKQQPTLFVSISGGGSGLGITSLLNGTADLANSSRQINPEELGQFSAKNTPIDSFIFAQDAIAFVVAKDLGIDSLSITNLANLLNGTFRTWEPVCGKNIPVNIYGRQSNSGTHSFVKNKLNINFSEYAKEMNGNAQILEAIKADHSGIGYVGAGYVMGGGGTGLQVLKIYQQEGQRAVSPLDAASIASKKYIFQRPLYQYFKKSSLPKVQPFLDFEKSDLGKKIINDAGYYPVNIN